MTWLSQFSVATTTGTATGTPSVAVSAIFSVDPSATQTSNQADSSSLPQFIAPNVDAIIPRKIQSNPSPKINYVISFISSHLISPNIPFYSNEYTSQSQVRLSVVSSNGS